MRISDWSSDVCSSDLQHRAHILAARLRQRHQPVRPHARRGLRRTDPHRQRPPRDRRAEPEEMAALQIADLLGLPPLHAEQVCGTRHVDIEEGAPHQEIARLGGDILRELDRKSTRLLQSLMRISYAVFCLKTKNK